MNSRRHRHDWIWGDYMKNVKLKTNVIGQRLSKYRVDLSIDVENVQPIISVSSPRVENWVLKP